MSAAVEFVTTTVANVTETVGHYASFGLASGVEASIIGGIVIGGVTGGVTSAVLGGDIIDGALAGGLIGGVAGGGAGWANENIYGQPSQYNTQLPVENFTESPGGPFVDSTEGQVDSSFFDASNSDNYTVASMTVGDVSAENTTKLTGTLANVNGVSPNIYSEATDHVNRVNGAIGNPNVTLKDLYLQSQQNQASLIAQSKKGQLLGATLTGGATMAGAYLTSKSSEEQAKKNIENEEKLLRLKYQLEDEERRKKWEGFTYPTSPSLSITHPEKATVGLLS